jgi:hypothetical protein
MSLARRILPQPYDAPSAEQPSDGAGRRSDHTAARSTRVIRGIVLRRDDLDRPLPKPLTSASDRLTVARLRTAQTSPCKNAILTGTVSTHVLFVI